MAQYVNILQSWQFSFQSLAYVVAALLFILALAGLSRQTTAQRGNRVGMLGMVLVLVAIVLFVVSFAGEQQILTTVLIVVALAIGAGVGIPLARRVEMTGMPELIAMLHSFVGLAAVLVGYNSFLLVPGSDSAENAFHMGEVGLAVFIGAVTFTGSIIAFLKLSGRMSGRPLTLPMRNWLNLAAIVVSFLLIVWFAYTRSIVAGLIPLMLLTVVALALGLHLVAAIGGGDMPVVVSMLNSYSGWAAAMAGFTLGNDLLIIVGALVGSSGAYLSYIMCEAMNRSFVSVILGGFGSDGAVAEARDYGAHREISASEVADMLVDADKV